MTKTQPKIGTSIPSAQAGTGSSPPTHQAMAVTTTVTSRATPYWYGVGFGRPSRARASGSKDTGSGTFKPLQIAAQLGNDSRGVRITD